MSKKPTVDHVYHAGKDKLKITIKGYTPGKKTRSAIIKKVMQELERSPDRHIALAKQSRKKREKKSHNMCGHQVASRSSPSSTFRQ